MAVLTGNIRGPEGPPGTPGDPGDPGADGASAYDVAVENGFEGTEQEWLDSLVGAEGAQGDAGPTGPEGPTVVSADADNTSILGSDGFIFTPAGAGEPGEPGTPGTVWFTGNGAPDPEPEGSVAGDLYLDLDTGDIYELEGTAP